MGSLPGEEVPASSKTASVVGREGGVGGPTHQAGRTFSSGGRDLQTCWSNDFVHRGPVGLEDGQGESLSAGAERVSSS